MKIYYHFLLYIGSFSLTTLVIPIMLLISWKVNIALGFTSIGFWVLIVYLILSFFDLRARRYESTVSEIFRTKTLYKKHFCAHCHVPLDEELLFTLSTQEFIFCASCGHKIVKQEIDQLTDSEILAEHEELLKKITTNPSPS